MKFIYVYIFQFVISFSTYSQTKISAVSKFQGALLRGLDNRLNLKTKLPIHVAEEPLRAVVRGTGIALKNIDGFRSVLMS